MARGLVPPQVLDAAVRVNTLQGDGHDQVVPVERIPDRHAAERELKGFGNGLGGLGERDAGRGRQALGVDVARCGGDEQEPVSPGAAGAAGAVTRQAQRRDQVDLVDVGHRQMQAAVGRARARSSRAAGAAAPCRSSGRGFRRGRWPSEKGRVTAMPTSSMAVAANATRYRLRRRGSASVTDLSMLPAPQRPSRHTEGRRTPPHSFLYRVAWSLESVDHPDGVAGLGPVGVSPIRKGGAEDLRGGGRAGPGDARHPVARLSVGHAHSTGRHYRPTCDYRRPRRGTALHGSAAGAPTLA